METKEEITTIKTMDKKITRRELKESLETMNRTLGKMVLLNGVDCETALYGFLQTANFAVILAAKHVDEYSE